MGMVEFVDEKSRDSELGTSSLPSCNKTSADGGRRDVLKKMFSF